MHLSLRHNFSKICKKQRTRAYWRTTKKKSQQRTNLPVLALGRVNVIRGWMLIKLNVTKKFSITTVALGLYILALWFEEVAQSWNKSLGCSHFLYFGLVSGSAVGACEAGYLGGGQDHWWFSPFLHLRHTWIETPGWASKQSRAVFKDQIKSVLKVSVLHSVEIRASIPLDLI